MTPAHHPSSTLRSRFARALAPVIVGLAGFGLWVTPALAESGSGASSGGSKDSAPRAAETGSVLGRVLEARPADRATVRPAAEARVYAYEIASLEVVEAEADRQGRFRFPSLPAGMYKLVAFKPGFQPTVELLLRKTADLEQSIELTLERERVGDAQTAEAYWTVRGQVPPDVMRQIHQVRFTEDARPAGVEIADAGLLRTRMEAVSGVENLGEASTQSTRAAIGVEGAVGRLAVDLDGEFQALAPRTDVAPGKMVDGEVRSVVLQLASASEQRFRVATSTGELSKGGEEFGLDQYQVDWTGRTARRGETQVQARYTQEDALLRGLLDPSASPVTSETLAVRGVHTQELGGRHSLRTGVEYSQRVTDDPHRLGTGLETGRLGDERSLIDERTSLFGLAESRVQPRVLVEYGLVSTVSDGDLSLIPQGGLVVELGDRWTARGSAMHRIQDERDPLRSDFHTALYSDQSTCRDTAAACYEVSLTRSNGDDESFRVGALHREIAETLRVYFSTDFFDRLESVFLVDGDVMPEVQLSLARRITPKVLARLESNIADGGGGIFYATDDEAYENQVRYLVTSLDTRFQHTSTGVFLAFHHLEQTLNPLDLDESSASTLEMQRLQLMLTQDLSALVDLAANWAVQLNMEVARGGSPFTLEVDDELRKRLTGGFSVSF